MSNEARQLHGYHRNNFGDVQIQSNSVEWKLIPSEDPPALHNPAEATWNFEKQMPSPTKALGGFTCKLIC